MAGLFAAEIGAGAKHFFEDVAVAHVGAGERDIFAGEDALEAEVGHGSGDDAIALELALGFEEARDGEEHAIPIDDFTGGGDEEGAVGVAIEGHTELGFFRDDARLQTREMQGAAIGVDIAAVRRSAHGEDFGAEGAEQFRAEFIGRAVGAIEHDAEIGEFRAGNEAAAEETEVGGVEGFIGSKARGMLRGGFGDELENFGFDEFLDGVGELHAGVGEKFDAIVVERIVRGGDDHAGFEIILANEAGYAGSGDDSGEGGRATGGRNACGEKRGDVRAGFAGVHADEDTGVVMFAAKVNGESAAGGVERGVVERRGAGEAADAVSAEE